MLPVSRSLPPSASEHVKLRHDRTRTKTTLSYDSGLGAWMTVAVRSEDQMLFSLGGNRIAQVSTTRQGAPGARAATRRRRRRRRRRRKKSEKWANLLLLRLAVLLGRAPRPRSPLVMTGLLNFQESESGLLWGPQSGVGVSGVDSFERINSF